MIENTLTNDFEDGLDLLVPGTKKRAKVLFQIKAELGKESDRGCALVAAAYLENELTELLDGFFVDQAQKARDSLFDFNGPAGTFSAKIKLAYALGLISTDIQKSLDLVRGLRNEFAHLHEPLTFAVPKIASRVVSLLPCIRPAGLASKDIFIEKIQSMAATIHLCISNANRRAILDHEAVPLRDDPQEQEIEIAACRMMKITAPEITYEQAVEMARKFRAIK